MKRIISFILVVCLVLGLLAGISISALGASAATDITGVTAPAVGSTLTTDGITGPEGFTVNAEWLKYHYDADAFHAPIDPVVTKGVYILSIHLVSKGEAYLDWHTLEAITINGEPHDNAGVISANDDRIYEATINKRYLVGDITVIDAVTIEALPAAEAGVATDLSGIVLPENAPYHLNYNTAWHTMDEHPMGPVLEQDHRYLLTVYLAPNEGYWFHRGLETTFPRTPVYNQLEIWGNLNVDFSYDLRPVVSQADLTVGNTDRGQPLAAVTIPANAGYTVDAQWTTWNEYGSWDPVTGSFGYGEYRLEATLYPAEGLTFTDDTTVTINGTSINQMANAYIMDWSDHYITVALTVDHEPANGFVDYVTVTGVPAPIVPGADITTPALPQITYGNATVTGVQWVDAQYAPVTGKFQDGKLYYLAISLKPAEGYGFRDGYNAEIELPEGGYDHPWVDADTDGNAVVYVRYSLQPTIDKVEITVTEPQIGAAPAEPKVPTGAKYTIESFNWYAYNGEDVATFTDGNRYYLDINIAVTEGYELADDVEFTINGQKPYQYGNSADGGYLCGKFSFMEKVNRVDITLPEYKLGDPIKLEDVKVPEGAKYTINQEYSHWRSQDADFNGTVGKDKYYLYLNLQTAAKHEFTEDVQVYINGKLWEDFYNYNSGSEMEIYYEISFRDVINKVQIPALPSVQIGDTATAPQLQAPAGAHYQLQTQWVVYVGDYSAQPFDGVFADKTAYYLSVSANADPGYEFAEDVEITVGGQPFSGIYVGDEKDQALAKLYSFGLNVIDTVELTTTAPEDGKTPGEVTAPDNAGYTAENFSWGVGDTDEFYEADDMKKDEAFAYDKYYFIYGELKAKEGFVFADNVKILVNGNQTDTTDLLGLPPAMGDMAIVAHGFGQLKKPVTPPADTPVTPPSGDSTPVAALVVLAVLAAAGMAAAIIGKKKFVK